MSAAAAAVSAAARGGRMAAWRLHGYADGGPRLEEARVPALRSPDHVLVRVETTSVNPLDVAMIDGYGSRILNSLRSAEACVTSLCAGEAGAGAGAGAGGEFPLVLGRDFVGSVVARGGAARVGLGARVWGVIPPHLPGAHAAFALARDSWLGPAPAALGSSAGGALFAALSAAAALRAAGTAAGPRRRVLLLGMGPVGSAALQLLVHQGSHVAVVCGAASAERALSRGAALALDRGAEDLPRAIQDAGPFDLAVDCVGAGGEAARAAAAAGGAALAVTLTSPLLKLTDERGLCAGLAGAAWQLARDNSPLPAAAAAAPARAPPAPPALRWAFFSPSAADTELLRRLAERGQFVVDVEAAVAWRRAGEAYRRAAARPRGKILIDFTDDS